MKLFLDGEAIPIPTSKRDVTFIIPPDWRKSKVLSVACATEHTPGGILASAALSGFVTDSSWRCSRTLSPGWQVAEFDDSKWTRAKEFQLNNKSGNVLPLVKHILPNASWITVDDPLIKGTIYCRKYIQDTIFSKKNL